MIRKNNFIVITGGPGAGKTSLLNALSKKGFPVVPESGRQIIRERVICNLPPRPAPREFAMQMFEADRQNFEDLRDHEEIIFFDRSFLDSAALLKQADPRNFEKFQAIVDTCRFNNEIFMAPPWKEIYRNDEERDQSFEEAQETYDLLKGWYFQNGYRVFELPKESIEVRLQFVLNELKI